MSRSALLILLMLGSIASYGQNISITFTPAGAATTIESVTATNLRTNQHITLPGNETLILTVGTGILQVAGLDEAGMIFPNPFSGTTTFSMVVENPQTQIDISVLPTGVYFIRFVNGTKVGVGKLIKQ